MRAEGTFTVASFRPAQVDPPPTEIPVGTPVGVMTMDKAYAGGIEGRSATLFTAAFDQATGIGTYVAMESFAGSLDGRSGGFAYAHSATTLGSDRGHELFVIVPGSGTGDLTGITGTGGMDTGPDPHRIWFDYELG